MHSSSVPSPLSSPCFSDARAILVSLSVNVVWILLISCSMNKDFFSQFNAVFSSCFGIWLTHCSQCMEVRLFQTTPRLHKKVIMLFVIKGPDSDYSEAKGCISGNAGKATRAVKTALLLQIKVNSIFLILWTSQHEHILQMLIARGNKVSPAYTFLSNLWGEHTSW